MIRRITAGFLALFALFILSGCNPKLTVEEYREKLVSCTNKYSSAQMKVAGSLTADEDGYFNGDITEFEENCKDFENAMKQIEEINPPDAYKEQHSRALKALDNEREWLEAVRSFTKAKTPDELKEAMDKIETAANHENSFPRLIFEIVRSIG